MAREASPLIEAIGVSFAEAIAFLRLKLAVPSETWTDIWMEAHNTAFTVAGASTQALVEDFQVAVLKAIEQGETLATFRQDFDQIVARNGWSYRGRRGWRTRVIFETNLRMAYAAGRWAQIERLKAHRPYLRYVTADDARVRDAHRAWHDVVLPVDHPFWETHFPPNGWGCRCRVVSLNARDLKRYGLEVTEPAPEVRFVAREVKTKFGVSVVETPEGVDPGFGYHGKYAAQP